MAKSPLNQPVHTFQIGKRTFASGLFWQPLRAGKALKKDAQEFASEHRFDLVTYHQSRSFTQAGFAKVGAPKLTKAHALAPVLVEALGQTWLAAFELPGGKMVMAASHDGAVIPGSDFYGSAEEVEENFNRISAMVHGADIEWSRIIAPQDWAPGAESVPLEPLLAERKLKGHTRIRQVKFKLSKLQVVCGLFLLVALAAGGMAAKTYAAKAEEQARLQRIEKARLIQMEREQTELNRRIAQGPWTELPTAKTMIDLCAQGWSQVPLSIEGWLFDNGRCQVNELTAIFRRSGPSTVGDFARAVKPLFGDPLVRENGEVAAIAFSADMPLEDEGELPLVNEQVTDLLTHLQTHGLSANLADVRKGGVANSDQQNEVAAWHAHEFSFETTVPPDHLFADLSIAGLRINHIQLTLDHATSQMKWEVSGDIYGK